jgi:hypothetical protein
MSTETECCICFETIGEKNNCVTPCGHKFCFVCLTKALTNNNTCPCCREVLVEASEEDDESEYESEYDDDSDSDDGSLQDLDEEEDNSGLTLGDMDTLSLEDFYDNAEFIYEEMTKKGITPKEVVQMLFSVFYGGYRNDLNDIGDKVEKKIYSFISKQVVELIKDARIKKEQMMFLQEDKERNINALDMIALNYA